MTETSNPEQGTGLMGAASAFEAFLAGEADNQTPQEQVEAPQDAPADDDQTEALSADAELDETPQKTPTTRLTMRVPTMLRQRQTTKTTKPTKAKPSWSPSRLTARKSRLTWKR